MSKPLTSKQESELTFEQCKEIDTFLEGYRQNPSNSNKWRYRLHAHIEAIIAKQVQEERINELTKVHSGANSKALETGYSPRYLNFDDVMGYINDRLAELRAKSKQGEV